MTEATENMHQTWGNWTTERVCLYPLIHLNFLLKKNAQCESYEDGSLGDSTSHSSEKLLQRDGVGGGGDNIYVILAKGEYMQSSTYFL